MFRYVAISWDARHLAHASEAARIDQTFAQRSQWRLAASAQGLRVYTIGSQIGINGIQPLPGGLGVILGKLFRRQDASEPSLRDVEISVKEGDRIIKSGGRSLIEDFWGRYIAFLPEPNCEWSVLRDPTGALPCYSINVNGVCLIFSWLEDIFDNLGGIILPTPNWDAIAAGMLVGGLGGRETALQGVLQILPGELTPINQQAQRPKVLWDLFEIARYPCEQDPHEAANQLRKTVMACAQSWAVSYSSILLRLSGGLDSSILLASICPSYSPSNIKCLNYRSSGADGDERAYARLAAAKMGVSLIECEQETEYRLEETLSAARTPRPPSYLGRMGTGRLDVQIAAANNAKAMFTGAGGDQLFYENRCTWPAADYLKLHGINTEFFNVALDSARLGKVSLWKSISHALSDQSFRTKFLSGISRYVALMNKDVSRDLSSRISRFMHPGLFEAIDLPIGKFHQTYELAYFPDYFDPYFKEAAPEVVNPLMAQPMMELCLSTPTYLLTYGGRGRGLARKAFANDIPREIATRRSKGGMEELALKVLQKNMDFARGLLLDGQLVREGLLDRVRLEASLAGQPSTKDAYVSEVHNCIAIEAWLQRMKRAPVGMHN